MLDTAVREDRIFFPLGGCLATGPHFKLGARSIGCDIKILELTNVYNVRVQNFKFRGLHFFYKKSSNEEFFLKTACSPPFLLTSN